MIKSYMKNDKKLYEVYMAVRDQNGKQICRRKRGIASEREARETEFLFKVELKKNADRDPIWTWAAWHEECVRRMRLNLKVTTVLSYDGRLKKWIPKSWLNRELSSFSTTDILDLMEDVANSDYPVIQRFLWKLVRRIFQMAVDDGILARNPASGIKFKTTRKVHKVLTAQEADILLQSAKELGHKFYPIWVCALKTGMRSGELFALKWSDVNFEAGIISVSKAWTKFGGITTPKTGDSRIVPISQDLKAFLLELRMKGSDEFVLPHVREWQMGLQSHAIKEFCRTLQITEVRFHDLRATFITNLLSQGVPLVKVMAIVGHKKMATTDVYLRMAGVDVQGATESLGFQIPQENDADILQFTPRQS